MNTLKPLCIAIGIIVVSHSFAQQTKLDIGMQFPNWTFRNMDNETKMEITVEDLKGKWTLLDFWSPKCGVCISSFPHLKEIRDHFGKELNLVVIARNNEEMTRKSFEKFSSKYNVKLTVSYDKELFDRVEVPWVPYYVILNPRGIIKALPGLYDLTIENLQELMLTGELKLQNTPEEVNFDFRKPLLINGNGGNDTTYLYRSLLTKWKHGLPSMGVPYVTAQYGNTIQFIGYSLRYLYFLAYQDTIAPYPMAYQPNMKTSYGEYRLNPVLEVSDSSEFMWTPGDERNIFCYSLSLPSNEATAQHMQEIMQRDLKSYFGYEVYVEKRTMPCWELTISEKGKKTLKTKGKETKHESFNYLGFDYRNVPMTEIIAKLWENFQSEPPFIDKTGMTENIDIRIETDLTDFEAFRKALRSYGLELKKGNKEMKVIVIRDKKVS